MASTRYASDLALEEHLLLEPLLLAGGSRGRPRSVELWRVLNAIFHVLRGGIPWRMLPDGFPPWKTVYHYFRKWRRSGVWERINAALRERLRGKMGRAPQPTASIIDSRSVKTTESGGPRGYDGGKKVNGRKRHLVVDTQGLVLTAQVHAADVHDRPAAELVLTGLGEQFPSIRLLWADTAYRGLSAWLEEHLGWSLEINCHWWTGVRFWVPEGHEPPERPAGFRVLPRRRVIERTFAWLGRNRRLSKDYERLCETTEAWIYLAMVRIMLRRLTSSK